MSEQLKPCPFCGKDDSGSALDWDCVCQSESLRDRMTHAKWNTRPIETALKAEIEALKAENDTMKKVLSENASAVIEEIGFNKNRVELIVRQPVISLFLLEFSEFWIEIGAENYIEITGTDNRVGDFTITIQRVDGKTPHQLKLEAFKDIEALKSENEWLKRREYRNCDAIIKLRTKLKAANKKLDAVDDLLESISTWFLRNQGMPEPTWVDIYKKVCDLFDPPLEVKG